MQSFTINDNITLTYIPMDKLKTTSVEFYIHRPLVKEDASKNAILPHILKRSCSLCGDSKEVAKYLENLYGAKFSAGIAKRGDDHLISFEFETISDKFAPFGEKLLSGVMDLALSMIFGERKGFLDEIFEQERKNSITKIENIINDKRVYALYRCQEKMAKGDRFAVPRLGYADDMRAMTREELFGYYKEMIISSPIDIFVCGEAEPSELCKKVKEYTCGMEFKKAEMPVSKILQKDTPVNFVTEHLDVTQGKLAVGFLTDTKASDDDYTALAVANAVFGGGAQSKLFNNVREKLSLAYYAGSMMDKNKGILMVNAGIEFENRQKAYDEIMVQLEEMKKGNITDLEFESSKGFMINSLTACFDDHHSLISYYLGEKTGQTHTSIEEKIEKIKKVTKEDAANAMKKVHLDTVYFLAGGEEV